MTRTALPNRRQSLVETIEFDGFTYEVGFGLVPENNRILEVFITTNDKQGSAVHVACADAAVLISLLLQHGVTAEEIGHSLLRAGGGPTQAAHDPASIIGRVVDRIKEINHDYSQVH